jgi:hypothetical protein
MSEVAGIDVAWTKPDPVNTRNAGYTLVIGYMSGDPTKNLRGPQIAAYRAAGLQVGLVWETSANRVLGGAAAGAADGAAADAQATAAGYPADCVLFFAVDFAATPAQFPVIDAYKRAFTAATVRPVGVYGSFAVVERFTGTPGCDYGWQTSAWSGSQLSAKAHLYQRAGHTWPAIPGMTANSYDEDVLCRPLPLFGSTSGGTDMPLTPADVAMILDTPIQRQGGGQTGTTTLRSVLAWSDAHIVDTLNVIKSQPPAQVDVKALAAAIVAALPAAQAQEVVNELGKRLNTPAA